MDSTAFQKTVRCLIYGPHIFNLYCSYLFLTCYSCVFVDVDIFVWIYICVLCGVCVCTCLSVVVVAEKNYSKPVTLTCRTDFSGSVVWKFQNEDIEFKQNIDPDGKNLVVTKVDTPMLGEYSCWNGTNKLSSTYLLLEYERDSGEMLLINFFFPSCS